uniref:Uncharacterized protein n=1 Tax=Rhizophora mucronata TaxID=61149 RepID=A0A2P2PVT4_RHIMU
MTCLMRKNTDFLISCRHHLRDFNFSIHVLSSNYTPFLGYFILIGNSCISTQF